MIDFQALRNKILDKAIRGELVPQLGSEPEVVEIGEPQSEVPFTIPEKWKWVRLLDVAHINPKVTATDANANVSFIPMAAVSAGYLNYISLEEKRPWNIVKSGYTKFADGDVLVAKITPCFQNRKSAIANNLISGTGCGSSEFHVLRPHENIVDREYLLLFVKSSWFIAYGIENLKGTAGQQRLGTSELKNCGVPLPPISEQRRIVAKTKKLFEQIDQAEKAYNELSGPLSERFRELCLERAIQGKLVPQLESEPKVELRNEKESFNIPFEIPTKWKWTTLEQICLQITDGEHKTPKYQKDGVPFLSVKDISSKKLNFSDTKFVSLEDFDVIKKRCHPQKGDILLSKVGSTGIPAIVDTDKDFALFVSVALLKLNKLLVLDKFLWYLLQSPLVQKQAKENTRGIGNKNWVLKAIKATIVPLPPIPEQRRIVDQLEKIFSSINSLSK